MGLAVTSKMCSVGRAVVTVTLMVDRTLVQVDREVFHALFSSSVVAGYAGVKKALEGKPLPFNDFLDLTRKAEIPYPLFFAPREVVDAQIKLKVDKLMSGFTKSSFSMNSRHRVELSDVELIVKDLLRKQALLRKNDDTLVANSIVGLLKKSRQPVAADAQRLMEAVGFTHEDIRNAKSKTAAVDLLIARLEAAQIFVSRSAQHFMPQGMPAHAKFSGITIKDKKVPFIFLATGNEGEQLEPAGRKLFTLTLLTVLVARGTFAPVNYDGHTKDETAPREYQLTAEILMPASEFGDLTFDDLDAVRETAEVFRVTPSAVAMRARRLGILGRERFELHMDALQAEYRQRPKQRLSSPRPVNALRNYNGVECSRRMLAMLDTGKLSSADFRRIVFFNKIAISKISEFREAVG